MSRRAICMALVALGGVVGCAESATGPANEAVDRPRRDDIRIEPDRFELTAIGERMQLYVVGLDGNDEELPGPELSWMSLDPDVATIDAMGVVEARSNGIARIVAILHDAGGTELYAEITVRQRTHELFAREAVVTAWVGRPIKLEVDAWDSNGVALPPFTLEWFSSDPSVAVVDRNGVLLGGRAGSLVVTAARDGLEVPIRVTVEHAFVLPDAGARAAR